MSSVQFPLFAVCTPNCFFTVPYIFCLVMNIISLGNFRCLLPLVVVLFCSPLSFHAQEPVTTDSGVEMSLPPAPRYGYCSLTALLTSLPEYAQAMEELQTLRQRYEQEALHNEDDFRRRFQEYLQGQKNFPEPILLKRQGDLERAMEEGLAFRRQADSLLVEAERELLSPLRKRIADVLVSIGTERGYDYIMDTDQGVCPFLNPAVSEDITAYALSKLEEQQPKP